MTPLESNTLWPVLFWYLFPSISRDYSSISKKKFVNPSRSPKSPPNHQLTAIPITNLSIRSARIPNQYSIYLSIFIQYVQFCLFHFMVSFQLLSKNQTLWKPQSVLSKCPRYVRIASCRMTICEGPTVNSTVPSPISFWRPHFINNKEDQFIASLHSLSNYVSIVVLQYLFAESWMVRWCSINFPFFLPNHDPVELNLKVFSYFLNNYYLRR